MPLGTLVASMPSMINNKTSQAKKSTKVKQIFSIIPHTVICRKVFRLTNRQMAAFWACYWTVSWVLIGVHWGLAAGFGIYNFAKRGA